MAEKTFDDLTDAGADGAADSSTQIKKRARRRLVGAVALALLAVILLPIAMDREPPPPGPEIQVRIPSQDAAIAFAPTPTRSKSATAVGEPTGALPPKMDTAEPPKPTPDITAVKPEPAAEPATPSLAASKVPAKETKPVPKTSDDKTRAEAALAGAVPAAKTPVQENGEKWIVQLGAYQNTGNVSLLMGKLKEMKIPAYADKFNSPQGPRTRVRAGPFATKEAAMKAAERVKILGVTGPVAPASADKT